VTDGTSRTGAARDVPPPRPVRAPTSGPTSGPAAEPEETTPLARAARAVADAVGGLLGTTPGSGSATDAPSASAASGLKDVLGAVAGAASAWRERRESATGPDAGSRSPGAFLGDLLSAAAPRLPIRDRDRLRAAYPGLDDAEIAEALIARSARLTAAVGAATGGIAAVQWFATPSLLALPLELGAETVLVAAVEVALLGELHELAGRPAPASAYLASWSEQRAVDGSGRPAVLTALTSAGLRSLSRRMGRRLARGIPVAAPFLVGAAVAGRGNRRATENLARRVLTDLRTGREGRG
jgi:hypothetical protein